MRRAGLVFGAPQADTWRKGKCLSMEKNSLKASVVVASVVLLLFLPACTAWWNSERDAIRRAVVDHEMDAQGRELDDIIVRLSPGEFRADLGHGSKMVWLVSTRLDRQYREEEYFRTRSPERSYLFLQDISIDSSQTEADVAVVVWLGSGKPISKELSLEKEDEDWEVTSERLLSGEQSP